MKEGWEEFELGSVCSLEKKSKTTPNLPYVGMEDIEPRTGNFIGSLLPLDVKSNSFEFNSAHLLYGRLRPYLNKVLLPNFNGHCSTEVFPMRVGNLLERKFLFYWLTSDSTVDAINGTCTGARMPRANMKEVMGFKIPIPPLPEQKRIVEILDQAFAAIDQAKANIEQNIKNAQELFQSKLNEIFSQRGDGWEERTFSELFKIKSGDGLTSKKMQPGKYPVYGGNGIAGYHNEYNLKGEQVVIGRVGALCGNARFTNQKIWVTDNAFRIVDFSQQFDYPFLIYLLNYKRLRSYARQAAQPVISNSSLKDVEFSFPVDISLQRKLRTKMDELQSALTRIELTYTNKLMSVEALRKSLLQKAFAGELTSNEEKEITV